ncbi:MAG: GNAT family N-acetyltransferase [Desulfuromonadales bacterium]|nr:GNAT family N-acetyltransferase [Desulfuromonadales bacterium]
MREILPLDRGHDRAGFDCGEDALNLYLQETARQHNDKGISKTFVYVDTDSPEKILGFFTLAICEVVTEGLPRKFAKRLPKKVPAAKLGRLAVSMDYQGQKIGGILIVEAMKRTLAVADSFGIVGFFVDAKNDQAKKFYEGFGFIELHGNPFALFLPLQTLKEANG